MNSLTLACLFLSCRAFPQAVRCEDVFSRAYILTGVLYKASGVSFEKKGLDKKISQKGFTPRSHIPLALTENERKDLSFYEYGWKYRDSMNVQKYETAIFKWQYWKGVSWAWYAEARKAPGADTLAGFRPTIEEVKWLDSTDRIGFATVNEGGTSGKMAGFWRVYDGTEYGPVPGGATSSAQLPREAFLESHGKKTQSYDNLRKQGYQLFELGRYVLDPGMDYQTRRQVKKALYSWLLESYLNEDVNKDKTLFILDPVDQDARDKYMQEWGARPLHKMDFDTALSDDADDVLAVDPATLKEKLLDYINKP